MIRVLLVDDQALLRTGFRMILSAQPDLEVVGEAADGAEAVRLTTQLDPDVVLMDVRMPHMDGVEATRVITGSGHPARVLILTTFDLDEYAFAGLQAGASGFLLKDVPQPSSPPRSAPSPAATPSSPHASPESSWTASPRPSTRPRPHWTRGWRC